MADLKGSQTETNPAPCRIYRLVGPPRSIGKNFFLTIVAN